MCVHYAPRLLRGCDEDDAPEVRDKQTANFCDYFKPSPRAFDAGRASADAAARAELEALFGAPAPDGRAGEGEDAAPGAERKPDDPHAEAEALFKR